MENVFVPERVQGFKALRLTGYKSVGQHKEKQNFNYTSRPAKEFHQLILQARQLFTTCFCTAAHGIMQEGKQDVNNPRYSSVIPL